MVVNQSEGPRGIPRESPAKAVGIKEAYAELQRPKVGRKARIAGEIGEIVDLPSLFDPEPED